MWSGIGWEGCWMVYKLLFYVIIIYICLRYRRLNVD